MRRTALGRRLGLRGVRSSLNSPLFCSLPSPSRHDRAGRPPAVIDSFLTVKPANRVPANSNATRSVDGAWGKRLERCRERTRALLEGVDERVLRRAAGPHLGPILWDLAHLAVYEDLWGVGAVLGNQARITSNATAALYDAFEQPRHRRETLSMLELEQAFELQDRVRARTLEGLASASESTDPRLRIGGFVWHLLEQHELQHAETMLQSLARAGVRPGGDWPGGDWPGGDWASGDRDLERRPSVDGGPGPISDKARIGFDTATVAIGRDVGGPFDNEFSAHAVQIPAFELDRYPVTNRRYAEFVAEGGYDARELWTAAGWEWRCRCDVQRPLDWVTDASGALHVERFGTLQPLDAEEPVQHVSAHEADAFARYAGGRLPTEFEWERAAATCRPPDPESHSLARPSLGPRRLPTETGSGPLAMFGHVYEWTASEFTAYPGFIPYPYREYSSVFFDAGYRVLRGCSWAAWPGLARSTYRNWDRPDRRHLFAGLRLAWDVEGR